MEDSKHCLINIMSFSIYAHTLRYEIGEELKKVKDAAKFFCITVSNPQKVYDDGQSLFDSIPDKTPKTRIDRSSFFEYYDNDKSEFEKICLLAHLALLSTNKNKPYSRVDKFFLYSRMDGKIKSVATSYKREYEQAKVPMKFPDPQILEDISDEVRKYATHRHWDKIRKSLEEKWYWNIPKRIPRINKDGVLEAKQIRGALYFTQLDENKFYEIIAKQEHEKHQKEHQKKQKLNQFIEKYNSKKC